MDKLKPDVLEAVSALEEIFNPEGMQGESNWQIVRDELHRLAAELEKVKAERDALREDADPLRLPSRFQLDDYVHISGMRGRVVGVCFVLAEVCVPESLRTENTGEVIEGGKIMYEVQTKNVIRRVFSNDVDEIRVRLVPEQEGSS